MSNPLVVKLGSVAALSADDRRALEAICTDQRTFMERKDIAREGERPEHINVLMAGWAARYKMLSDGSRQITAFVLPGDTFDMGAAVLHHADHSVIALTPVTVAKVTRGLLMETTRERPVLAQAFWWAGLVDEAVLRTWIVNLGRRDAYARVAHLVCELQARMKRIGMATDHEFDLPLTQEQLADALGLTSVHVNRTLQRLRSEGVLSIRHHVLTINDAEQLRAAAGFRPDYLHQPAT